MTSVHYPITFRKRVCEYALKHGNISEAELKYNVTRQTIHRWLKRFDGTKQSLADKSRRPHSHPNQHTQEETEFVIRLWHKNKQFGLDYLYGKLLRQHDYKRSRETLYRVLRRNGLYHKPPKKRRKRANKPYYGATVPGQKLQMDVKYVPSECMVGDAIGKKFYQYTIIDEATSLRYIQIFDDKSNWNSVEFVINAMKYFPFGIKKIQTDNGTEFTNRFLNTEKKSAFENFLETSGIDHQLLRPATPWHNGRVERSHRTDQKFFYDSKTFYSLQDAQNQAKRHLRWYNNLWQRKYNYRTPMEVWREWEKENSKHCD